MLDYLLVILALAAPIPAEEPAVARTMIPAPELSLVPGPALEPAAELRAWLDAAPQGQLRLPVVLAFADEHRLALGQAWLGVRPSEPGRDAILLSIEDSALGIALLDRVREHCPGDQPACAMWLEGYWKRSPHLDADFSLRRVLGLVEPGAEARVWVEAPAD